jgi:hypothetical protein
VLDNFVHYGLRDRVLDLLGGGVDMWLREGASGSGDGAAYSRLSAYDKVLHSTARTWVAPACVVASPYTAAPVLNFSVLMSYTVRRDHHGSAVRQAGASSVAYYLTQLLPRARC